MSEWTLTLLPQGGLCNRMRAIDSALALTAKTGHQLIVQWQLDEGLNCRFEDLFDIIPAGICSIITQDRTKRYSKLQKTFAKRLNHLRYDQCLYERNLARFIASQGDLASIKQYAKVFIASCSRFYGEQPYFRGFQPTAANQQKIHALTCRFGSPMIGIHIRRTDHVHAIASSPTELFIERMDNALRENEQTCFFVATDCPTTEAELARRFPGHVVTHEKRSRSRADEAGIGDALIDLYGLAACDEILGSVQSSFSETAAQIRGIPLSIVDKRNLS